MMQSSNTRSLYLLYFILPLALGSGIDHWKVQDEHFTPYTNFEIDEENSLIVVATINKIYHLSFDLQLQTDVIEVPPESGAAEVCQEDLRPGVECQNYHRILVLPQGKGQISSPDGQIWNVSDTILACSSNAYYPLCHYRNRSSLQSIMNFYAEKFHPYSPYEWIPSLWTSVGKFLVGTPIGEGGSENGLSQSTVPFNGDVSLITIRNNVQWFNKVPHFVSMHEIGDYIYIFFREEAIETEQQVVYSRVARICKNDTGMLHDGSQLFSTFIKARISCTTNNNNPIYHYNEIYGTYYSEEENKIYAVFQAANNGPLGSAMCAFSFGELKNDLERVFQTSYLVRFGQNQYAKLANSNPFTCLPGSRPTDEVISHLLMSGVATPTTTKEPLIKMERLAYQRIVMQRVNDLQVFFITATNKDTNSLLLLKMMLVDSTYHLLQTTTLATDTSSSLAVTSMKLHGTGTDARLYIGTETELYRVPLDQCSEYKSCCECVTSRDPYCAYNFMSESCGSHDVDVNGTSWLVQELVNGDAGVCSVGTPGGSEEITPSTTTTTTIDKGPLCSGGVKPSGVTGEAGGGGGSDSSSISVTQVLSTPDVSGLGSSRTAQNFYSLIIVGVIAGFIGGVIIGILTMALFKRLNFSRSRRNKAMELTRSLEISNDTKTSTGHTASSSKEENINNKSELTSSNNNYHYGKDYTNNNQPPQYPPQPTPPHRSSDHQPLPPHKPHKPHKPLKYNSTHSEDSGVADCSSAKMLDMPTQPPQQMQQTEHTPISPSAKSKHKAQGEIFTFTHPSIPYGSSPSKKQRGGCVPSTPPYATSPYTMSVQGMGYHTQHSPGKMGGTLPRDPNLQRNYKAEVHLTQQQREAYGRNLLARTPSIDGSKAKYIYSDSESRTLPHTQRFPRQQDFVHIDAEMGCSQC